MSKTLDILRREHRTMSWLLDLLERQIDLLEKTGLPDFDLLVEITDYFRSFPDLYHHPKEDLVLRKIADRDKEAFERLAQLETEHDELSEELRKFSRALINLLLDPQKSRNCYVKSARDFLADERKHMEMEEKYFFPAAEKSLDEDDWSEIDQQVTKFSDPLFEKEAHYRFVQLRSNLSKWRQAEPV